MSETVQVQLSKNILQAIDISKAVTIQDLKTVISHKIGKDVDSFDLLFSGNILHPETSLQDLRLGQSSVLHVYAGARQNKTAEYNVQENGLPATSPSKTASVRRYQYEYYVYCKKCSGLQPGKLRVRCSFCLQGAILLDKEPCEWDDVLLPGRLLGDCTNCEKQVSAQFYFKCSNHDGEEEFVALRHVRPNRRHIECVTCSLASSPVLVYPCSSKHVICIDCFMLYAQVSLDERRFVEEPSVGYSLPCPAGCEDSLIQDIHHFRLLGNEQYERYKDFGAEECLLHSGGLLCPNAGCGEGIIVEDQANTVTCRTCQLEFCRRCRQEIHMGPCRQQASTQAGTGFEVDSERALRARWDAQSLETIQETTKPCPKCAVKTEKSGGCMHMKCSRCSCEWCWICEKDWNRTCQGDHWFG